MSVTKSHDPDNQTEKNVINKSTLYLVPTPIGNLADISERSLKVLSEVDFIAAEDTRNTLKLLTRFGIKKPLVSYYEHNKRQKGGEITARIIAGESCALVTDAGTPAISDPGEDLVALCIEKGIEITSIPGPCAAITALTLSGMPTGRFCFEGFLSVNKGERKKRLCELKHETRTLIFYEAPHKLKQTLSDLYSAFGDRGISLCRELTKLNEEIIRTTLSQAVLLYEEKAPRGEFVLVLAPGEPEENPLLSLNVSEHLETYISRGMNKNDAMKAVAADRGVSKSEIYRQTIPQ